MACEPGSSRTESGLWCLLALVELGLVLVAGDGIPLLGSGEPTLTAKPIDVFGGRVVDAPSSVDRFLLTHIKTTTISRIENLNDLTYL